MKKLCLPDISVQTNFDQKRSINECSKKNGIKVVLYDFGRPLRSYFIL